MSRWSGAPSCCRSLIRLRGLILGRLQADLQETVGSFGQKRVRLQDLHLSLLPWDQFDGDCTESVESSPKTIQ